MKILYCPLANVEEAKTIARTLINSQLAFCCNIVASVDSIYFWKDKRHEDSESLLIVKTHMPQEAAASIKDLSSYVDPVVLAIEMENLLQKNNT